MSIGAGKLSKVEVVGSKISETGIEIKYKIKVTNASKIWRNKQDNSDTAEVIIAIKTGQKVNGWMMCTIICLFAVAMLLIPAYRIEKRRMKE